jgi:hypothetical protein
MESVLKLNTKFNNSVSFYEQKEISSFFFHGSAAIVDPVLLIVEVSISHSEGQMIKTDSETSTWHRTTL